MINWQFDKKFIKNTMNKGFVLLKNPIMSLDKRKTIKNEINIFSNFYKDDFNFYDFSSTKKIFYSIDEIKKYTLKEMEDIYKTLGRDTIVFLLKLNKDFEFASYLVLPSTPELTIEEQAKETLEMYKLYSENFYKEAKKIMLNPEPQIHIRNELDSVSWCFDSNILKLPLLIIDPCESSSVLVRELQKAI